jgi:protein-tyrosine phosphatase
MCLSFAPSIILTDVPDPYYEDGFNTVFDMIEIAGQGLLAEIKDTHNL